MRAYLTLNSTDKPLILEASSFVGLFTTYTKQLREGAFKEVDLLHIRAEVVPAKDKISIHKKLDKKPNKKGANEKIP